MTGTMLSMDDGWMQELAKVVQSARLDAGLSKEAVARKAEVSSITYKRIEDAERVRDASLARVMAALGIRRARSGAFVRDEPKAADSVGGDTESGEEFEFLTRVREDLTTEEMDTLMEELNPYLERLVRDIKRRRD